MLTSHQPAVHSANRVMPSCRAERPFAALPPNHARSPTMLGGRPVEFD